MVHWWNVNTESPNGLKHNRVWHVRQLFYALLSPAIVAVMFAGLDEWRARKEVTMKENREFMRLQASLAPVNEDKVESRFHKKNSPHPPLAPAVPPAPVKAAEHNIITVAGTVVQSGNNDALRERLEHLDRELAAIRAHLLAQTQTQEGGGEGPEAEGTEISPASDGQAAESDVTDIDKPDVGPLTLVHSMMKAVLYLRTATISEVATLLLDTAKSRALRFIDAVRTQSSPEAMALTLSQLREISELSPSEVWANVNTVATIFTRSTIYPLLGFKDKDDLLPPSTVAVGGMKDSGSSVRDVQESGELTPSEGEGAAIYSDPVLHTPEHQTLPPAAIAAAEEVALAEPEAAGTDVYYAKDPSIPDATPDTTDVPPPPRERVWWRLWR